MTKFSTHGYTVVHNTLDSRVCRKISKRVMIKTTDIVFTNRGYDVSGLSLKERCELLVNSTKRDEYFGDQSKESVWRNGNSRKPIHSKSCGMIHIHYDSTVLKHVTLSDRPYTNLKYAYKHDKLVHAQGFERVGIKPQGTPDMDQHLDINPFYDSVNYDSHIRHRIQSLITVNIDEDINPRDSGTIEMIPYFHLYFKFFSVLFHPETGLNECKMEGASKGRFFTLPKGNKGWDKKYLPLLRMHIKQYQKYINGDDIDLDKQTRHFYRQMKKDGVAIPREDHTLEWTPIKARIGDHILWDERIPHRNLRNKSEVPRIVVYYSLFPVDDEWYQTAERDWLLEQIDRCQVYYSAKGEYNHKSVNDDEQIYIDSDKVHQMVHRTEFRRKIVGVDRY